MAPLQHVASLPFYRARARFIILARFLSRSAPGSLLSLSLQLAGFLYHALRFTLGVLRFRSGLACLFLMRSASGSLTLTGLP